ncbi:MAG TPA: DUF3298 domain-containing protein [Candidatus Paceibacterota bacterium]|nr:DUF3298 domain-containing protein [Candidatus Paceibacterota bacterium]
MTLKQGIYAFGLLAILAVIFGVWASFTKPPTFSAPESHPLPGEVIGEGLYQYTEDKPYYHIEVLYPPHTALKGSADVAARAYMEGELAKQVASFKEENNLDALTPEDVQIQGLGGDRKYTLGIDYKAYAWKDTVSFVYSVYVDTLGAHPNGFYRTFVFDAGGNNLTLENLFVSGSPYLNRLSAAAYSLVLAQLKEKAGEVTPDMEETVRMGTEPTPEALQFFYLQDGDLHLLFPPYQVAAYAAGSFDVAIPLSDLADILDPRFK